LLEEIEAIDMHGLIPRNGHYLAKGGTTTNMGVLGMHAAKSGAVINGLWNIVVGMTCIVRPIQYLVVNFLWEIIINNK
jgi:hypothetical protein